MVEIHRSYFKKDIYVVPVHFFVKAGSAKEAENLVVLSIHSIPGITWEVKKARYRA